MNEFDEKLEQKTETASAEDASEGGAKFELIASELSEPAYEEAKEADKAVEADEKTEDKPFANAVEWVCTIVFAGAVVILINLFLFRAFTVDGDSMCDTLQDNDFVITTNFAYKASFGDVVVIRTDKLLNPETRLYGEPIIKRVIGTAGDTIRFNLEKGEVYRNGELLTEDYIIGPTNQKYNGWVESDTDYVVPENCIFVLGDNRKVSHDSRDLRLIGFVDEKYIMGKALFRLFPLGEMKWL
ncbi:MAG: signal peptidase I [Oscillospiraceae bacterium]|nr:signal peptidase I [Oscillospiraceae bacterium]